MTETVQKINLLNLDLAGMRDFFESIGEKPFRAVQVFKWIYHEGQDSFESMTNLSQALRAKLPSIAEIKPPPVTKEQISKDGTRKWLMSVTGGSYIETVFIPEENRGTLCVSSQVGCALNCRFCSTATQGFSRNLSTSEIIGQVWQAVKQLKGLEGDPEITNIVMMGMGEPLLNLDALIPALNIMRDDNAYAFAKRRVTVSTSGVVPNIDKLAASVDVALAVSLHAPNDELRSQIIPINKKYPIAELMDACRRYVSDNHRHRVTMEYVLLKGVNDSPMHAKQLTQILSTVPCKVNLIPFNPYPGTIYECPSLETIIKFRDVVMKAGFVTTTRKTRGADIDAACGQLVGKVIDRTKRNERFEAGRLETQVAV